MPVPPLGSPSHSAPDGPWLVVAARFHDVVVSRLIDGATAAWRERGVSPEAIVLVRVAGAFEVPQALSTVLGRAQGSAGWQGAVGLAAIVRGDTPHFEHVCRVAVDGLMNVGLRTGIPVGCGILTCDTLEQALARSGGEAGDAGRAAAAAAYELSMACRLPPA